MAQFIIEQVLAALRANKGMAINDHGPYEMKVEAIALMGDREVVAFYDETHFSLNSMYIDIEGRAHVSTYSNGIMYQEYIAKGDFQAAIDEYNKPENHTRGLGYWKITNLTYVKEDNMSEFNKVLEALRANNNVALDDHMAYTKNVEDMKVNVKVIGEINGDAVFLEDFSKQVTSYSVNRMVVDSEGNVHITKASVTILDGHGAQSLTDAIHRYNQAAVSRKIVRITDLKQEVKPTRLAHYEHSETYASLFQKDNGMFGIHTRDHDGVTHVSNHESQEIAVLQYKKEVAYLLLNLS